MQGTPIPPSEGERGAISGYYAQYSVSASLILQELREDRLEWIRVADPKALRVDDLLLGIQGRVDAYQVKWTQYEGTLTFRDLAGDGSHTSSLIEDLARGWRQLKETYSSHRVVVHLVTNAFPSTSPQARLPVGDSFPTPSHFAAFLAQVWEPAHRSPLGDSLAIPSEWLTTWDTLRASSLLSEGDFEAFVRDCELELRYPSQHSSASIDSRDELIAAEDTEKIVHELFQTVAAPERIIELNRNQLLRRLGWSNRFEFKSRHHFPIDEVLYQPIESTGQRLTSAIDTLPGGYLAVTGTPGSGKSTLLTKTLKSLTERVVTYYAYVPDSPHPMSSRGESSNFLHDVVLQIEKLGFSFGKSPSMFDRAQLLDRFYEQLGALHSDWSENARKTIILIDGLDHIEREQQPSRALLDDLPDPNQVPDGVYFVLGTQTDAPIPSQIQAAVRLSDRRIEMQPLERRQVYDMIKAANLQERMTFDQQGTVYELSAGHPLALTYILRKLQLSEHTEALIEGLQQGGAFDGDIEAVYHSYWTQFSNDADLCNFFGLLARARGPIDLAWVRTWAADALLQKLGNQFAHYFRIERPGRLYFFHNSFRLFLKDRTSEFPAGSYDPSMDVSFHSDLADLYARSNDHPVQAWEELFHRFSAGQHKKVVALATQEYFRRQFFDLRPLDAIHTDVMIALRSASHCEDATGVARLCLVGSEMRQREYYFQQGDLVSILLGLGEYQLALEQLRTGRQLRASAGTALEAASLLVQHEGLEEESRRIFELAEPFELMGGSPPMNVGRASDDVGLLENWARLAILFRDMEQVIYTIRRIESEGATSDDSSESTYVLQSRLLLAAGLGLLAQKRWSDLSILLNAFDPKRLADIRARFWLHFRIFKDQGVADDTIRASEHLNEMVNIETRVLGPEEKTALAECILQILGNREQAKALIADVDQPELRTDLFSSTSGLGPFRQRFRLNRLAFTLGDRRSSSEIVPESCDPRDQGVALFERGLCTVAHIWARAWMGQTMDRSTIEFETLPLLRVFCRSFEETRGWSSWFAIKYAKHEFYTLLVQAVAQHGREPLETLWQAFEREWKHSSFGRYWATEDRRPVIRAFVRSGFPQEWGRARLRELDEMMIDGVDLSERVEECMRQAETWLELGDHERARHFVRRALEVGFGVGYRKDYQMDEWIQWLGRINDIEPENACQRILSFAGAIEGLRDSTEGPAASSAAEQLLTVSFRWSPVAAVQLFLWFLDKGLIGHQAGINVLSTEAVKATPPSVHVALQLLKEFVIPFGTADSLNVLPLLIKSLSELGDTSKLLEEIRAIADRIRFYANPAVRSQWLSQLKQVMEDQGLSSELAGLNEEEVEADPINRLSQDTLSLNDGDELLSRQEVEETVSSVDDISQLLEVETEDSFFGWTPVVTKLIHTIGDEESLLALARLFRDRRHAGQILANISRRLSELGAMGSAWTVGMQALEASSEFGWNDAYDGGTRLLALRALSHVDDDKTKPLLYRTLISDLQSNPPLVTDIASNLYHILPLLDANLLLPQIWDEIEEHTAPWLWGDSSPIGLKEFAPKDLRDTPKAALVHLIAVHLDHPCLSLAQASQRALGRLLGPQSPEVAIILKYLLTRGENYQERVLMLLDAVSVTDPSSIIGFEEHVEGLRDSPNWLVRLMALSISRACGWEIENADSNRIQLPAIYDLSVPPRMLDIPDDALSVSPGEPILDSEDPYRIVSPYNSQIRLVAMAANVPEENSHRRAVAIMHSLGSRESTWSAKAERRLRSLLSAAGIRLPFVRPRARFARRAMFHMVAELIDAGRIDEDTALDVEAGLRTYDRQMVLAEPISRPTQLQPIDNLTFGADRVAWVEGVSEALADTDWAPSEGTTVLAEKTHLRTQGGSATEDRYSLTKLATYDLLETVPDADEIFETTVKALISEYPQTAVDSDSSNLVVRNSDYGYDSPGADWACL